MVPDERRTSVCTTVVVAAAFAAVADGIAEGDAAAEADGTVISAPPTGFPEVDGATYADGPTDKKLHELRTSGTLLWMANRWGISCGPKA